MLTDRHADRLRGVFAAHPAVRGAFVFGSVATGHARERSDLDLGIVVDAEQWDRDDKVPLISDCMEAAERDWIDLVVLNDAPLVLQFEAVRHHNILYEAAGFHAASFVSKVVRMYWDFEPHLRRQRKAYKKRRLSQADGSA